MPRACGQADELRFGWNMEFVAIVFVIAALFRIGIYGHLEMSVWRYGVLKAMAAQSRDVNRALQELLRGKADYKISNREFRALENVYVSHLNRYLLRRGRVDDAALRREILKSENFEL